MLSGQDFTNIKTSFDKVIDTLGVPAAHETATPPYTKTNIATVGFASVGKDDQALINTLGVNAKVITIKAASLPTRPAKLDRVTIGAEIYTLESVHEIMLNATVIGFKCYVKGR